MASLSTIQIIGNLGKDPETRFIQSGRQVTSFNVAVNRVSPASGDRERREETEWFRVSCWGQLATTAEQFLQKGRRVYVSGRFSSRQYTATDGQQRTSLEINADQLVLLDSAQRSEGGDDFGDREMERTPVSSDPTAPRRAPSRAPSRNDDIAEDDIPF